MWVPIYIVHAAMSAHHPLQHPAPTHLSRLCSPAPAIAVNGSYDLSHAYFNKKRMQKACNHAKALPRFELGSLDSESSVITTTL